MSFPNRPATIQVSDKSIRFALLRQNLRPIRTGKAGELEIRKTDPHPLMLGLMFPQRTHRPKVLGPQNKMRLWPTSPNEKGLADLNIAGVETLSKRRKFSSVPDARD